MKFIIIIFITCFLSINLNAQKIATFKFSLILENVEAYNNFTKELESFKKKIFVDLKNEELGASFFSKLLSANFFCVLFFHHRTERNTTTITGTIANK